MEFQISKKFLLNKNIVGTYGSKRLTDDLTKIKKKNLGKTNAT